MAGDQAGEGLRRPRAPAPDGPAGRDEPPPGWAAGRGFVTSRLRRVEPAGSGSPAPRWAPPGGPRAGTACRRRRAGPAPAGATPRRGGGIRPAARRGGRQPADLLLAASANIVLAAELRQHLFRFAKNSSRNCLARIVHDQLEIGVIAVPSRYGNDGDFDEVAQAGIAEPFPQEARDFLFRLDFAQHRSSSLLRRLADIAESAIGTQMRLAGQQVLMRKNLTRERFRRPAMLHLLTLPHGAGSFAHVAGAEPRSAGR